jgi:sensor c-di-GMP phosphodiesterase-like protein
VAQYAIARGYKVTLIGLAVIAEGMESIEQADFLRSEACDEAQGFLFARPMPACDFEALLRKATHGNSRHCARAASRDGS